MFGGEGSVKSGNQLSPNIRKLLDDMWSLEIKSVQESKDGKPVIIAKWAREFYEGVVGSRSNYTTIFITQRYQEPVRN